MKKILFFTNNINKVREAKSFFSNSGVNVVSLENFNLEKSPLENGSTFSENAKIKSFYGYKKFNLPCFADDSGICIEALNWKPNIFSKRFLESFKNENKCFKHIIEKVKKTKKNKAFFHTSISLTLKENYHIVFEGKISGTISEKVVGKKGFGYDPIFLPDGYNYTFGQMKRADKNSLSHRSVAINKLVNFLIN